MPKRIVLLLAILITLPYICAYLAAGEHSQFTGFLFNPQDGNSYLAKMYQGWRGEWTFSLPFTSDPGEAKYLFTFYLALGHFARISGLPLVLCFHLARLASGLLLAWMVWKFIRAVNPGNPYITAIYSAVLLGSGMGWLFFPFGQVTADFWIAEAYPFLSAYANPHFSLSLALLLMLLLPVISTKVCQSVLCPNRFPDGLVVVLASIIMTSMSPFAFVLLVGIGIGLIIWGFAGKWLASRKAEERLKIQYLMGDSDFRHILRHLTLVCLGGFPTAFYLFFASKSTAELRNWDLQNITLSPPPWDLMAAFSPALFLAVPGIAAVFRSGEKRGRAAVVWAILALLMAYLPFSLQRRFLLGLYIPLTILAGFGLEWATQNKPAVKKWLPACFLALSFPTTILTLMIGQFGVFQKDSRIYLNKSEAAALVWIQNNTGQRDLVLADTRMGLFIPAHTGRRVIYGHPYETVNADQEKQSIADFFQNMVIDPRASGKFLLERHVDYLLLVSQEASQEKIGQIPYLKQVFDQDGVLILKVIEE